jgi:tetratricopeptide (TPR) repeat protein
MPLILLLYHSVFRKRIRHVPFAGVLAVTLAFVYFRVNFLSGSVIYPEITEMLKRIPGFFAALTMYLKNIFVPFDMGVTLKERFFAWTDRNVLAGIVIMALAAYAGVKKRRDVFLLFSLGWFFILIFPAANIYPLGSFMANRWLYLPSVGIFLLLSRIFVYMLDKKIIRWAAMSVFAVIIVLCGALVIRTNAMWIDPMGFFVLNIQRDPNNVIYYDNLGVLYLKEGNIEAAKAALEKAIKIDSGYYGAYSNLGNAYYELGEYNKARALYEKSLEINPGYARAHYNLANLKYALGEKEDAVKDMEKAIELNPNYVRAYNNLGRMYAESGNLEKALETFTEAVKKDPNFADSYNNIAAVYFSIDRQEEALDLFRRAIRLDPESAEYRYNLGMAHLKTGEIKKAIISLKKAMEIDPLEGKVYYGLSRALFADESYEEAVKYCDMALDVNYKVADEYRKKMEEYRN